MIKIGIIREGKSIPDYRVPLTPQQCLHIKNNYKDIEIVVQPSPTRCFSDSEYADLGITMQEDLSECDVLFGVKEVPIPFLIRNKTYFFFSHTKKKQPYNRPLMQALIARNIKMIDYEALTYDDGSRIIGFGYFAGVVGAHNGIMAYGKKSKQYSLIPAHVCKDMNEMLQQYNNVNLPPVKIAVTGSGKVTSGIIEIMNRWDIQSVEPNDFANNTYSHPVYTLLKGATLYQHKETGEYSRKDFYAHPEQYKCIFEKFASKADILMNGIYWDSKIAPLFTNEDVKTNKIGLKVIADVTCDPFGSVPINVGVSVIADPVYGIDRKTLQKTTPFQTTDETIDVMAVDNLPNELPRDASEFFGNKLIKYIIKELQAEKSDILDRATICEKGKLTPPFEYLSDYAYG